MSSPKILVSCKKCGKEWLKYNVKVWSGLCKSCSSVRIFTEETRRKLSIASRNMSKEARMKISIAGKGRRHSEETRRKMSIAAQRERNSSWKGGISPLNKLIRSSIQYKEWHKLVLKRDHYLCTHCKKVGTKLQAHHITPFSLIVEVFNIKTVEDSSHASFLWDASNGITLCKACHKNLHTKLHNQIEEDMF